jgi:hypothetical protein
MYRGRTATVTVSGAAAGQRAYLVAGLGGVGLSCPPALAPACLSVKPPHVVLGSSPADTSGFARIDLPVPDPLAIDRVAVQAVALGASPALSPAREVDVRDADPLAPFTFAALPDTQHYSDNANNIANFVAQTQWVVDQGDDIVFATHLGDIVQDGATGANRNQVQWDRAFDALSVLDGDTLGTPDGPLPYSIIPGNHDLDVVGSKSSGFARYLEYFDPVRYEGRSWYVGASPSRVNTSQVFTANGLAYLHLGLEYHPSDEAIAWAQGVLAAHPGLPTIVSTHEHLGTGDPAPRRTGGGTPDATGDNNGEDLFRKLVEPFPSVFLVLSGHVIGDGRRTTTAAMSQTVHEVLSDYQSDPGGGNGWMTLVDVDPAAEVLTLSTFSPTYIPGVSSGVDRTTLAQGNFVLDLDLVGLRDRLEGSRFVRLRQGQDFGAGAYTGTVDMFVANGTTFTPDAAYDAADNVRIDGDDQFEQGLLRFDDLIGCNDDQVPPGATVLGAWLTLTTEGDFADSGTGASFYRMTTAWSATDTWTSLGDGLTIGVDTVPAADGDTQGFVGAKGTDTFDVAASVQAWADGEDNHGWALLHDGNNRWEFRASDWEGVAERPLLTVEVDAADRGSCP